MLTFSEVRLPLQLTLCQLLQGNAHLLGSVTSFTTHCMSSNRIKLLITLCVNKLISGSCYLINLKHTWILKAPSASNIDKVIIMIIVVHMVVCSIFSFCKIFYKRCSEFILKQLIFG